MPSTPTAIGRFIIVVIVGPAPSKNFAAKLARRSGGGATPSSIDGRGPPKRREGGRCRIRAWRHVGSLPWEWCDRSCRALWRLAMPGRAVKRGSALELDERGRVDGAAGAQDVPGLHRQEIPDGERNLGEHAPHRDAEAEHALAEARLFLRRGGARSRGEPAVAIELGHDRLEQDVRIDDRHAARSRRRSLTSNVTATTTSLGEVSCTNCGLVSVWSTRKP